ncbi:hypothetical protein MHYP_G00342830 [Metynnis hypsauchen]
MTSDFAESPTCSSAAAVFASSLHHIQRFSGCQVRALAEGDHVMVKDEFRRITTVNLEQTFLTKLDFYTPKLLTIFKTKGGVAGTKLRCLLDSLGQDISKGMIKDSVADLAMKIIVLASAAAEEGATPDSVIIVNDRTELSP